MDIKFQEKNIELVRGETTSLFFQCVDSFGDGMSGRLEWNASENLQVGGAIAYNNTDSDHNFNLNYISLIS